MEAQTKSLRKIKLVVRPSSAVLKIALVALIVFSMAALISLSWVRQSIQVQTEDMRQQAVALQQQNEDLENKISILGTNQSVEEIARDELGLVTPDTVIITPNS